MLFLFGRMGRIGWSADKYNIGTDHDDKKNHG